MDMTHTHSNQDALVSAFKKALIQYKPWHQAQWNSSGKDSLHQIIEGAEKVGMIDQGTAVSHFGITATNYTHWRNGDDIPDRKMRKKIWTFLKRQAGI